MNYMIIRLIQEITKLKVKKNPKINIWYIFLIRLRITIFMSSEKMSMVVMSNRFQF